MNDSFSGMHWMLVTPFNKDESVDTKSIKNLVNKAKDSGCVGVVVLGEMGEWRRLNDAERSVVLQNVMDVAAKDINVTIGTTASSTFVAISQAQTAEQMGASAIMVSPPPIAKPNPDTVMNFYKRVSDAVSIPIVIQDFPQSSGVHMSPQLIAEMAKAIPNFKYLKLEDPPTPTKLTRIRNILGDKIGIFGGLGGAFLLDELNRGSIGAMTGFAYPEVLVKIVSLFATGNHQEATDTFNKYLPLILFENQEGINLSIRKEAIKARGLISNSIVRHPAGPIDNLLRNELFQLIEQFKPDAT
jgi:4-hydroxy-tetrahydrodipicolinate synthase